MAEAPMVIDIEAILKSRIPRNTQRFIPRGIYRSVSRIIRQDELNEILRVTFPGEGSEFARKVLKHLDISVQVEGFDRLPSSGRFMFASNHPLGGLDGIALIAILGERYGDDNIRFLVNDMLMHVEPLRNVFLPVNKFGRQGRESSLVIQDALNSEAQVLQFPAGLCSRLQEGGLIADLEWQKSFVTQAMKSNRDIVPVFFKGHNSRKFYKTARWRKKLGLKFNIEQILLPSEVCKARGSSFKIIFGEPISIERLKISGKPPKVIAAEIRETVYKLGAKM